MDSFRYCCLGNPRDRGAWWATVHGVAKELTNTFTLRCGNCGTEVCLFLYLVIYLLIKKRVENVCMERGEVGKREGENSEVLSSSSSWKEITQDSKFTS